MEVGRAPAVWNQQTAVLQQWHEAASIETLEAAVLAMGSSHQMLVYAIQQ
jgi:hypothetical protein